MELVLLPGMDGTGILFQPLLKALPINISTKVITYPCDEKLGYAELIPYVKKQLPKGKEFILLAESFSGPIAYQLASHENLKAIIFVASFIERPNKLLILSKILPFSFLIPKQLPAFLLKFLLGALANKEIYKLVNESLIKVKKCVLVHRLKEMEKLPINNTRRINKSIYLQAISDKLVAPINAVKIKAVSNETTIYKIEGSHFILQVNPEKCSEIVLNEINLLTISCTGQPKADTIFAKSAKIPPASGCR